MPVDLDIIKCNVNGSLNLLYLSSTSRNSSSKNCRPPIICKLIVNIVLGVNPLFLGDLQINLYHMLNRTYQFILCLTRTKAVNSS